MSWKIGANFLLKNRRQDDTVVYLGLLGLSPGDLHLPLLQPETSTSEGSISFLLMKPKKWKGLCLKNPKKHIF
jgi:hypothetical protein